MYCIKLIIFLNLLTLKIVHNIIITLKQKKGGDFMATKRTYQPNKRKCKKKHGFFARKKSNILTSRRKKGRKRLSK